MSSATTTVHLAWDLQWMVAYIYRAYTDGCMSDNRLVLALREFVDNTHTHTYLHKYFR